MDSNSQTRCGNLVPDNWLMCRETRRPLPLRTWNQYSRGNWQSHSTHCCCVGCQTQDVNIEYNILHVIFARNTGACYLWGSYTSFCCDDTPAWRALISGDRMEPCSRGTATSDPASLTVVAQVTIFLNCQTCDPLFNWFRVKICRMFSFSD